MSVMQHHTSSPITVATNCTLHSYQQCVRYNNCTKVGSNAKAKSVPVVECAYGAGVMKPTCLKLVISKAETCRSTYCTAVTSMLCYRCRTFRRCKAATLRSHRRTHVHRQKVRVIDNR
eukprot:17777-Heterococcus_DN1.PRE.3